MNEVVVFAIRRSGFREIWCATEPPDLFFYLYFSKMDVIIPCARMQSMPLRKIREMYVRYERRISAAALLAGFIFDNITFPRINLSSSYLILMIYLAVSGAGIFLINLTEGKVIRAQFFERIRPVLLFVIQFCFGALFSSFVVFYSRGSALASSWPFLLMLILLLVRN